MNRSLKKVFLLFGIEGVLFQFVNSVGAYGNTIYATNLGATDTQIGLIQTVPNLVALILLIPIGILADRMRFEKTVPALLLFLMGGAYTGLGFVPGLGNDRMIFYFLFLGAGVGLMAGYNAQWQVLFGAVTETESRNKVYTFRNRCMFFIGTIIPLICGAMLSSQAHSEGKLTALRVFYFISGAFLIIQAFIILALPCERKSDDEMLAVGRFNLKSFLEAFVFVFKDRKFRGFFFLIMFFYLTWHVDWSMWYIEEIGYMGLNEFHLAVFSGLICVFQLIFMGFFSKFDSRFGPYRTMLFASFALALCPFTVVVCSFVPMQIRPYMFIGMGLFGSVPQCAIGLCVVEMLLEVLPGKNRALVTSIYTMFITLSNCLMPLFGVKIYEALGGNIFAVRTFNITWFTLRMLVFTTLIIVGNKRKKSITI
ncbi:MAG: MFS transporter [Lachnospiraceae bacterium]|nr:MFS transporter [Lachnospiraceae bacterium]